MYNIKCLVIFTSPRHHKRSVRKSLKFVFIQSRDSHRVKLLSQQRGTNIRLSERCEQRAEELLEFHG